MREGEGREMEEKGSDLRRFEGGMRWERESFRVLGEVRKKKREMSLGFVLGFLYEWAWVGLRWDPTH